MDSSEKPIVSIIGEPTVTLTEHWAEMTFPLNNGTVLRLNREEMEGMRRFFRGLQPIPVSATPAYFPDLEGA